MEGYGLGYGKREGRWCATAVLQCMEPDIGLSSGTAAHSADYEPLLAVNTRKCWPSRKNQWPCPQFNFASPKNSLYSSFSACVCVGGGGGGGGALGVLQFHFRRLTLGFPLSSIMITRKRKVILFVADQRVKKSLIS